MCIRLHGLSKVNLVLEPFLGIGNTAVACARLGVSMVGFEIDEEYLKAAVAALEKVDGNGRWRWTIPETGA